MWRTRIREDAGLVGISLGESVEEDGVEDRRDTAYGCRREDYQH